MDTPETRVLTPINITAMCAASYLFDVEANDFVREVNRIESYVYRVTYETVEAREVGHTQHIKVVDMGPRDVNPDALRAGELASSITELVEADHEAAADVVIGAVGAMLEKLNTDALSEAQAAHIRQLREALKYVLDVCQGKVRDGYKEIEARILRDFGGEIHRW